jgi:hypothetical protein
MMDHKGSDESSVKAESAATSINISSPSLVNERKLKSDIPPPPSTNSKGNKMGAKVPELHMERIP